MSRELPFWGKIVYGMPQAGFFLTNQVLTAWLLYFYTTGALGGQALVPPALAGGIIFGVRLVDGFADPVIARFSDNFKSKWGRRIPFMAVSGIFLVLSFIALFYPFVREESVWNTVYLAVLFSIYFIMFTAYVCPYLALLPELARTTTCRINLATYKAFFGMTGTALALIGAGLLIERIGYQGMAWLLGLTALFLLYIPVFNIRETEYTPAKPATLGIIKAIKYTLQNRPFLIYLVGTLAFWFAGSIVMQSVPFYITVLLEQSESMTSYFYATGGIVAVFSFPFVNLLSKKIGLKNIMMYSIMIMTIILPVSFILGYPIWGINPVIIAFVMIGIAGIPISSLFIVPDAIVASITDMDEVNTGERREAMYFGAQGFTSGLALGLSTLVIGGLFQFFGHTPEQPLGIQLTGPVAALFVLAGLIVFSRYPEEEVLACHSKVMGDIE